MFIPGTDKDKADELMSEVLKMQDEFVTRISHTEPGNVKVVFIKNSVLILMQKGKRDY